MQSLRWQHGTERWISALLNALYHRLGEGGGEINTITWENVSFVLHRSADVVKIYVKFTGNMHTHFVAWDSLQCHREIQKQTATSWHVLPSSTDAVSHTRTMPMMTANTATRQSYISNFPPVSTCPIHNAHSSKYVNTPELKSSTKPKTRSVSKCYHMRIK